MLATADNTTTTNPVPDKEVQTGFADRLNTLMDKMGRRKFGRIQYVAEVSELSWSGAKRCIEADKHPTKLDTLLTLFNNLLRDVRTTFNPGATLEQIQDYLLYGDELVLDPSQSDQPGAPDGDVTESVTPHIDIDERYAVIPPIMQALAMKQLNTIAETEGVNIFKDLIPEQSNKMVMRFAISWFEHKEQNKDTDSPELTKLAKSLIQVAQNALL